MSQSVSTPVIWHIRTREIEHGLVLTAKKIYLQYNLSILHHQLSIRAFCQNGVVRNDNEGLMVFVPQIKK